MDDFFFYHQGREDEIEIHPESDEPDDASWETTWDIVDGVTHPETGNQIQFMFTVAAEDQKAAAITARLHMIYLLNRKMPHRG